MFQMIGGPYPSAGAPTIRLDSAKNAVLLGCVLIALTTLINSIGVRLLARINNIGVIAELIGVALLIVLLAVKVRRGPAVLFETLGHGDGSALPYLGPFLAASLMASYVLYGFDTAGSLAEETDEPRRRAPWAILQALAAAALAGGLLMMFGILAVSDPWLPELGQLNGGLALLVKDVLGTKLGPLLLVEVVFAVFVCALTVHAGSVRLLFAMARDGNLPFAHALSHVPTRTRTPILPAVVIGVLAATILVVNINLPQVIETLCSVAIVWANLAYLLVTFPLLVSRFRRGGASATHRLFSMGRFGLPINAIAVVWGLFVVINIGWPRTEIYGSSPWGRFAAPLATLVLIGSGMFYYVVFKRQNTRILAEHIAEQVRDSPSLNSTGPCVPQLPLLSNRS
jgi:urea carboxylase system permease